MTQPVDPFFYKRPSDAEMVSAILQDVYEANSTGCKSRRCLIHVEDIPPPDGGYDRPWMKINHLTRVSDKPYDTEMHSNSAHTLDAWDELMIFRIRKDWQAQHAMVDLTVPYKGVG